MVETLRYRHTEKLKPAKEVLIAGGIGVAAGLLLGPTLGHIFGDLAQLASVGIGGEISAQAAESIMNISQATTGAFYGLVGAIAYLTDQI